MFVLFRHKVESTFMVANYLHNFIKFVIGCSFRTCIKIKMYLYVNCKTLSAMVRETFTGICFSSFAVSDSQSTGGNALSFET